ncbi:hypothetical protein T4D_12352 [Trichinella pseudospiralis]|uniref:Uncharacterized protein n=1 Tax=Trichinella pseudospiralis TaxID=6337 RepID=A0A0V1FLT6_TRIPS|nr:hypothetical protein T4D_12352 [Trichinella pseudospiralis]
MFLALLAVASSENSNNMNIQHVFWHRRNGKESHHITDPRRIALDNKVKAALECKHLVFAIELEWSLEIQITDLEVLFSLPMASKGTTRDLMVVRFAGKRARCISLSLVNTWLEVNVPPVSTTLGSQLQRSDIPQVTTANVIGSFDLTFDLCLRQLT